MTTKPTGDWHAVVHATLVKIAERLGSAPAEMTGGLHLVDDLRFTSLDYAELSAVLELELGVDPFQDDVDIGTVHTVDDVVRAYDRVL